MATVTLIEALHGFEDDEIVMIVRGTITALKGYNQGEGPKGPWTVQSGTLKDESGEISFSLWNHEELDRKTWLKKTVEFRCGEKPKGGWGGIKKTTSDYNKKAQLDIRPPAELIDFAAEYQPEPKPAAQSAPAPAPATAPQSPSHWPLQHAEVPNSVNTAEGIVKAAETAPKPSANDRLQEAMAVYTQMANTQIFCIDLVHRYVAEHCKNKGHKLDAIFIGTLVQNLLITGEKYRLWEAFPKKEFPIKKQETVNEAQGVDQP